MTPHGSSARSAKIGVSVQWGYARPSAKMPDEFAVGGRDLDEISEVGTAGSAAAAGPWRELRDLGLLVGRRIVVGGRAAAALEERDAAQTGLGLAILLLATFVATAARPLLVALGMSVGVGLIVGLSALTLLLLRRRLAFLAAIARQSWSSRWPKPPIVWIMRK